MKALLPPVAAIALVAASTGCRLSRDLLPRTHTISTSPDGRHMAYVYQGLNPDPPDDHLYLGPSKWRAKRLMSLAPDADWCRTILWSPDSRRVGFLINEQRLALFDTASGSLTAMLVLAAADGYPGSREARHVAIGNDGEVTFDRYQRATTLLTGEQGVVEAPVTIFGTYGRPIHRPERFLGQERVQLPPRPLTAATSGSGGR